MWLPTICYILICDTIYPFLWYQNSVFFDLQSKLHFCVCHIRSEWFTKNTDFMYVLFIEICFIILWFCIRCVSDLTQGYCTEIMTKIIFFFAVFLDFNNFGLFWSMCTFTSTFEDSSIKIMLTRPVVHKHLCFQVFVQVNMFEIFHQNVYGWFYSLINTI